MPIEPSPFPMGTTLTLVSLEDPTAPRVVQTAEVEGSLVSARQVGGTARIVLRSEPIAMYDMMQATDGAEARAIAAGIDSDALLPRIAVDGEAAPLGGCDDVLLTAAVAAPVNDGGTTGDTDPGLAATSMQTSWTPSQLPSTVTVLTVGETLDDVQPVSVQGAAETIYASTDALYVAAGNWDQAGSRTDVHRFDLPADGPAVYTGSGRVPGRLLNQFSLSDHDGVLRVVTTVDGPVGGAGVGPDRGAATTIAPMPGDGEVTTEMFVPSTSSRLAVLDTEGDTLDEVGHLDGLGVGEEVQSVRFMGDTGYVVTFRQTDPLYALDLSDPRAPRSLGELKIPGFSEYLHPIGDGLLLGIGRDADPATGMDLGFKASLFDVSDPAAMVEVDQFIVPDAWSDVSGDHKAFTWDAERSQAIFPLSQGCSDVGRYAIRDGAVVLRVADGQLSEVARISHQTPMGQRADALDRRRRRPLDAVLRGARPVRRRVADRRPAGNLLRCDLTEPHCSWPSPCPRCSSAAATDRATGPTPGPRARRCSRSRWPTARSSCTERVTGPSMPWSNSTATRSSSRTSPRTAPGPPTTARRCR